MHTIVDFLSQGSVPLYETVLRSIVVYLALLVGLRLIGRRELGQMSVLDVVLLLILASALETSIQGEDASVLGGILAFAVLLGMSKLTAWASFHMPWTRPVLEGQPVELIRDGRLLRKNIRHELITEDEIRAELTKQGIDRVEDVESFVLDVEGTPVVRRKGDSLELRAIRELGARLDAIERRLRDPAIN